MSGAEADGKRLDAGFLVSMHFWCYPKVFISVLREDFLEFLKSMKAPLKDEYLLPIIPDGILKKSVEFSVLPIEGTWFWVTYEEDKADVVERFRKLNDVGAYQMNL